MSAHSVGFLLLKKGGIETSLIHFRCCKKKTALKNTSSYIKGLVQRRKNVDFIGEKNDSIEVNECFLIKNTVGTS